MQMKNMSIKSKLITAFVLSALLLVVIGFMGETNMKKMYKATDEMYSDNLQSIDQLHLIKQNLLLLIKY